MHAFPTIRAARLRTALLALGLPLALAAAPAPPAGAAAAPVPAEWLTPAEIAGFRATPSYAETLAFLRRLEAASPAIRLSRFGVSPQGREMPLVIVSAEGAFTPEAAWRLAREEGKPVVLVQNGVHSGEIDGKDASLMILRDLAIGRLPEVLEAATLLVVPIYNVDGHERVSPYNRPNQDGPAEGMGFRTSAQGLDLNRDHLKAVSPEARAVIDLFNRWRPHLHVDDHVTDGSEHDWVLTWSWAEAPLLHPALDAWMDRHLPPVLAATEAAGHPAGPYVSLLDDGDPARGFDSNVDEPRYATGYYPLRNRPSVLVEMHSYKPYGERVLGNRAFLVELLREVGRSGEALIAAAAAAEADTVAKGRPDAAPSEVVLRWETGGEPDRLEVPFHDWYLEDSVALGVPILRWRGGTRAVEVPWLHRPVAVETAARPRGYLVLPGWPQVEQRLRTHGLVVERLTRPLEVAVETIRVTEAEYAAAPYQAVHRAISTRVERRAERRTLPAGSLWVPADQPDFAVAVQLFEPEAPDSLFSWGLLSAVTERKEYIEARVLEPRVREMLADPAVRAAWEAALAADPELAGDPRARWLWWYRRTPYWDDTVGLLPVLRAMRVPPALATEPWRPVAAGPLPPEAALPAAPPPPVAPGG
jgi:hypothetical protein